ncbi:MAG: DUF1376 domain-containing protein [Flavobacteriales bacterium]|nr:DUF1376 domain-containing protein [Flavobacteriales bacterium]
MAQDPAFLFYHSDWLTSTNSMKADERGYYIQLLANQSALGSLPNDIEELANLAGVRFSEFETFKQVFEHTLKAKFILNTEGRFVNLKLVEVKAKRKEFSQKQSIRGKIGAKIKKAIKDYNLDKSQQTTLRNYVKENNLYEKNIEDLEVNFKHMLEALLSIENENINNKSKIKNNGGVGEFIPREVEGTVNLDFDLPKGKTRCLTPPEIIIPFTQPFHQTWQQWKTYLKAEFNTQFNSVQAEQASLKIIASLANGIEEKAIAIVEQSMGNRWKTFYELKNKQTGSRAESRENIYPDEFLVKHGLL